MKHYITIALCIFLSQMCTGQVMMLFSSDSLTNITSPLDVDSLFYWFAADVGVTDSLGGAIATDEGVGTWNDLSGNGHHVTQTTDGARPVYKATGGPGSKPCIQFDGTDDFLASAAHWWGSDDLTIFVVMKWTSAPSSTRSIVGRNKTNTSKRQWFCYSSATPVLFLQTSTDGTAAIQSRLASYTITTAWTLSSIVNNVTAVTWFMDGSSQTVTGSPAASIFDDSNIGLFVGARDEVVPDFFLQGSIGEIIVFSRALTATERLAIENYLNKKYDLY